APAGVQPNFPTQEAPGMVWKLWRRLSAPSNHVRRSTRRKRLSLSVERLDDRIVPSAVRDLAGFSANTMAANDDESAGPIDLGFTTLFAGADHSQVYVNNNGNVTFNNPLRQYTPSSLSSVGRPIIAPFFADVDTRVGDLVHYGTDTVD